MSSVYYVVRLDTESWLGPIHGHPVPDVHEAAYFLTPQLAQNKADGLRVHYDNATVCQITLPQEACGEVTP